MTEKEFRDWVVYFAETDREQYAKLNTIDKDDWRTAWIIYNIRALVDKHPGSVEDYILRLKPEETPEEKKARVTQMLQAFKNTINHSVETSEGPDAHRNIGN